jgi:hypothetical protein
LYFNVQFAYPTPSATLLPSLTIGRSTVPPSGTETLSDTPTPSNVPVSPTQTDPFAGHLLAPNRKIGILLKCHLFQFLVCWPNV